MYLCLPKHNKGLAYDIWNALSDITYINQKSETGPQHRWFCQYINALTKLQPFTIFLLHVFWTKTLLIKFQFVLKISVELSSFFDEFHNTWLLIYKLIVVDIMVWCHQATRHYLKQHWLVLLLCCHMTSPGANELNAASITSTDILISTAQ